jgi:hypothetical protein
MVEAEPNLGAAVQTTRALLEGGFNEPIFEATFEYDGVLVRVDVLEPRDGGWLIAEVKSSAGVKDYHLGDLATQIWVLQQSGVVVTAAAIRHITSGFLLERAGDYRGLFTDADRLEVLAERIADRPRVVADARAVLAGPEPEMARGDHCASPFICEFSAYCARDEAAPPEWPISLLPRTGKILAETFADQGVLELTEVAPGALANPVHERIREVTASGVTYHDPVGAIAATQAWAWPRAFLDFETIAPAVPLWVGTKAFQQIPFQFSCHVEDAYGGLSHSGFLSIDGQDPRRACAEALIDLLDGDRSGSVIAYNAAFERRCVLDLAEAFPDLAAPLRAIAAKIVDLLPVARNHYYHRDQRGSWSIKAVLPTIAPELSYEGLTVKDGGAAQEAWREAADPLTEESRRSELKAGLEVYCERDTEAMIVLLDRLVGADARLSQP